MGKSVVNMGESINARLREIARRTETDTSTVQTRYALERLLYRISCSKWKDKVALKGALIFVVHDGDIHRPTGDIDLNGFMKNGNVDTMRAIIEDACSIEAVDGIDFRISTLQVRKERDWSSVPGGKIELDALIHTSKVRVRIDMGFGNAITPQAEWAEYPSILQGMPRPRVLVYPYTTMISEKLHAMVKHGAETTRLRDYYDIWSLITTRNFDGEVMGTAVRATFGQAGDPLPALPLDGLSDDFIEIRSASWDRFRSARGLKFSPPSLSETVEQLRPFVHMVVASAGGYETGIWKAGQGWTKSEPALSA